MSGEIIPPREPIVNETGNITQPWYRYLVSRKRITDAMTNFASLVVGTAPAEIPNARQIAVAAPITGTDGGPAGNYTIGLAASGVTAATYGAATKLVVLAIDAKGRVTAASEVTLNSDNVAEGLTNLYFTQARARGSVSGSAPISYNSGTGAFSLADTAVAPGSYGGANKSPSYTVDAKGRLTAASNTTLTIAAISGGTPCADGVHTPVVSITTKDGIITAIS